MKDIRSALISVYDKTGLLPILKHLAENEVRLISTGGTYDYIKSQGYDVQTVESLTDYPSILGGRVKTLHPKVFGGLLGREDMESDRAEMEQYQIDAIDLCVVDLYPFEETVRSGATHADVIEKIDIGGISLIRAAAKNYNNTLVISSKNQYDAFLEVYLRKAGKTDLETRKKFAAYAFDVSAHYDKEIFSYLNQGEDFSKSLKVSENKHTVLRYGENPHQEGRFYGDLNEVFKQLNGKPISYNNLIDLSAGIDFLQDLKNYDECAFIIIKHTNACGFALGNDLLSAYQKALAGDPQSAFGGIFLTNKKITKAAAAEMHRIFFEICIAPDYDEEALAILKQKSKRIILKLEALPIQQQEVKTCLNGYLYQNKDHKIEQPQDFEQVTHEKADQSSLSDLALASIVVKNTKSNAIVLLKDGQLVGSGTGQTSRVDALNQAIAKAKKFKLPLEGAVMASDAFFPFPDCVEIAHQVGIKAVVQPGGSIKDQDSIDYCNQHRMAMVFTGTRHFKH